jgi:uncharacterized protein HemX
MKEAPVFRFFFTPLEWIFFVLLILGVCGYITYPLAIEYVTKKFCLDLYKELEMTRNDLLKTQNEFENIKKKLTETQNKLDKSEEKLKTAQKKIEELEIIDEIEKLRKELEKTQNDLSEYQNQVYEWQDYCRKMLKYLDTINVPVETRPSIPKYFQFELDRSK